MASWLGSALGGAFEGYNEVQAEKRQEDRSNRMLEKELTLTRDFAIKDEKRLEAKAAKENIQSLGLYYNPANIQKIVNAGTGAVSNALLKGKELQALSKDANAFINSEYLEATSLGKVKYVGDKGWDGHVSGMITKLKQPKKVKRRKGADPIVAPFDLATGGLKSTGVKSNLPLFKPMPKDYGMMSATTTDWDDAYRGFHLDHINAEGKEAKAAAHQRLLEFTEVYKAHRENNPDESKTSPWNQQTYFKDGIEHTLGLAGFEGKEIGQGIDKKITYMIEGREGQYYAAYYSGINDIYKFSTNMGHLENVERSQQSVRAMRSNVTEWASGQFREKFIKQDDEAGPYVEDGGINAMFQHASKAEIDNRTENGKIPIGAIVSWPDPKDPSYVMISVHSKYGSIYKPSNITGTRIKAEDYIKGQMIKFPAIYNWKPKDNE
tara:strand:- start:1021 stop:2328 length:1308 start_codon:yes stop_codon:yes gene_type:complete